MRSRDVAETKPRRSRGAISPSSIVESLVISRIVCISTYSILCDFGAYTSFYACTRSCVVVMDFNRRMRSSNVQGFASKVLTLYEEEEE